MINTILRSVFSLTRTFAALRGYRLTISRPDDADLFEYYMIEDFWPQGAAMKLYAECLAKVSGEETDNLLKRMRFHVLAQLVEQAAREHPEAEAAECGCWKGHSTLFTATLLTRNGFQGGFHVFDSFEGGLSEFRDEDKGVFTPQNEVEEAQRRQFFMSHYDEVRGVLKDFDFVKFYKGWIPERFAEVEDSRFGFVNIDVDLYAPIKDSLEFFYPRLVEGGVIYLDDYATTAFPGARKAVDEFRETVQPSQFISMPYGSAFLIK